MGDQSISSGPAPATLTAPAQRKPSRLVAFRRWPVYRQYLLVLIILFTAKQAFNVIVFPPFTGHDEVAHFAYTRIVADEHRIPVIPNLEKWRASWQVRETPPGDYFPNDLYKYRRYSLDWCCDPIDQPRFATTPPGGMNLGGQLFPNGWQYAGNHPPMYYALLAPLYAVTDSLSLEGQQYVLRAAAIPIGILVIVLTYLMAGLLFPRDRFMMAVAPTFVAFQTQVSYEAAMINNDILLIGMYTVLIYLLIRGVRQGFTLSSSAVVGLAFGLGLLAKASMLSAAPLIALAILMGVGIRNVRRWVAYGISTVLVAGLVCWPWFAFLYRTYGNLSGLKQVKALQYNWTYRSGDAPSILDQFWNRKFAELRWRETWGEFGWRLIHLERWHLWAIGIPLLIMAVAAVIMLLAGSWNRWTGRISGRLALTREQCLGLWLLVVCCVVAYGAMLQFGTDFRLTQARYYFNAVSAIAILLAFGLRQIVPPRFHPAAIVAFLLCMVSANLLIYSQHVLPYWYLPS